MPHDPKEEKEEESVVSPKKLSFIFEEYTHLVDLFGKAGEWQQDSTPYPVFVNAMQIGIENRIACAMHHSLNAKEPLHLMIPLDKNIAHEIDHVTIVTKEGEIYSFEITLPKK